MANINRVEFTTTSVTLHLSDGSFWYCLYTQVPACFLYPLKPAQRENYTLENRDRAVTWPDVGQTLYLDDKNKVQLYVVAVPEPEPVLETA